MEMYEEDCTHQGQRRRCKGPLLEAGPLLEEAEMFVEDITQQGQRRR